MPYHLIGISSFIVVPGHYFTEIAVDCLCHTQINNRSMRIFYYIRRYYFLIGNIDHPSVAAAFGLLPENRIYFFARCFLIQ